MLNRCYAPHATSQGVANQISPRVTFSPIYYGSKLESAANDRASVVFRRDLDTRHRLIDCLELFRGTIDGAAVHPREVVKEALASNAAAVILAHNHPSGVAEPSQADEIITTRLRDALALIDVRVLDHLIIAGPTVTSLAERGVL